jgi:DNA-binding NtrC family response regulator
MKIVVVDDEPTIVLMCRRVLEAQGHAVHGFTDVKAALAQLEAEDAEMLVVDYKMPELNGLEFVQRAWALRPALRVVMITAHGTREIMNRATETGVKSVVLKPFTPSELAQGVAAAAGSADPAGGNPAGDSPAR